MTYPSTRRGSVRTAEQNAASEGIKPSSDARPFFLCLYRLARFSRVFLLLLLLPSCVKLVEICGNGIDDDGDGLLDCAETVCTSDPSCQLQPENCSNGADDDGDGVADCNDSDCLSNPSCQVNQCGNGSLDFGEQCDGGNLNGEDCVSLGFGNGELSCSLSCTFNTVGCAPITTACGDDVVAGNEVCDGANLDGEDCTSLGFLGGNLACNANCLSFDTSACLSDEVCDNSQDDDGDGNADCLDADCAADPACQVAAGCGDGTIQAGEQCDDGNTTSGDCCSATCQNEAGCEVEVNNTTAQANTIAATLKANISPAGDVDFFKITVADNTLITAEVAAGLTPCGTNGIDSLIQLIDKDGVTVLDENEDISANDFCSRVAGVGPVTAGTYFVRAVSSPDFAPDGVFNYVVNVSTQVVQGGQCGNGTINTANGEKCDDGNTTNGDCCDSDCQIEPGCEEEPNNTAPTANDLGTPPAVVKASAKPATDVDFFKFSVPATADVRVETFDGNPALNSCAAIDTTLKLFAPDGTTQLATDADDGIGSCSLLNPGAPQNDTAVRALAPGDYFAQVVETGQNAEIPLYQLQITLIALCGNNQVEGTEACDDGNTNSGDGCRNDCRLVEASCGDSVVQAGEQCDDGNQNQNDACKNDCTQNVCGDGVILNGPEECDDNNTATGDGCDATCQIEATCGNGVLDTGENCDDGNNVAGDCCNATCRSEAFCEIEDNDLVSSADLLVNDAFIGGNVFPGADLDVFSITIGGISDSFITATTLAANDPCATAQNTNGIDSILELIDTNGTTVLTSNDDINVTTNRCSSIQNFGPVPPGTYFIRAKGFANDTFNYKLLVDVEVLDDEPNNTSNVADRFELRDIKNADDLGNASVNPAGDVDFYSIFVPNNTVLSAEVVPFGNSTCGTGTLDPNEIDSLLEIRDTNGTTILVSNDDINGTTNFCSKATTAALPPGTYFIRVRSSTAFAPNQTFAYNLNVEVTTSEVESNNNSGLADAIVDEVSANITPAGDFDFFSVTVRNNSFISAETIDGADACGSAQNPNGIDSLLELRDTNGSAVLSQNDDINVTTNRCSRIDNFGPLAAGTYFLRVSAFSAADTFGYQMRVMVLEHP